MNRVTADFRSDATIDRSGFCGLFCSVTYRKQMFCSQPIENKGGDTMAMFTAELRSCGVGSQCGACGACGVGSHWQPSAYPCGASYVNRPTIGVDWGAVAYR